MAHRGPDAFGWMYEKDGEIVYKKFKGCVDEPKKLRKVVIPSGIKWLVLHVRKATTGDPRREYNNHPIVHGSIVGVHNGTIKNYSEVLEITGRTDDRSKVDSEAIFAAVNRYGDRIGLESLQGPMVAVYSDQRRASVLNFARTEGRYLWFLRTAHGNLAYASEKGILEQADLGSDDYRELPRFKLLKVRKGKVVKKINLIPPSGEPYMAAIGNRNKHEVFEQKPEGMSNKEWLNREFEKVMGEYAGTRKLRTPEEEDVYYNPWSDGG